MQIAAVHHINGAGLRNQNIQDIDIVQLGLGNIDKGRNASAQIQERVQLDAGLGFSESRPREQRQAQIDRAGIQGIDGLVELNSEIFFQVKRASVSNQHLSKISVDAPIPIFIGSIAFFILLYMIASKLIPLVPVWEVQEGQMAHSIRKYGKEPVITVSDLE